jgi:hypothetical protein
MAGLIARVAPREVFPAGTCFENPENGVQDRAQLDGRSAGRLRRLWRRQQWLDNLPLSIGQIHDSILEHSAEEGFETASRFFFYSALERSQGRFAAAWKMCKSSSVSAIPFPFVSRRL